MDIDTVKTQIVSSPAFIIDGDGLHGALQALSELRAASGCKVLYSIKSLPLMAVLKAATAVIDGFSVSSLFEAQLAAEALAGQGSIHLTTPGIRPDELLQLAGLCTHISLNSLNQHQRYTPQLAETVSVGLRVNPQRSFIGDARYDPCRQHSKLGIPMHELSSLAGIEGLHLHTVFAVPNYAPLLDTLAAVTEYFGDQLAALAWLNLGGGYLYAQISQATPFINVVSELKSRYSLEVYIEPGNSVVGANGCLMATVIDSFESDGKTIAVLDTSVNHLPEVFEYQIQPLLHEHQADGVYRILLAGSTCLAGDLLGEYTFSKPLNIGDRVVFKQVGAYSLVKANRFNGYNLPDVYWHQAGNTQLIKHYDYQQYRQQWC